MDIVAINDDRDDSIDTIARTNIATAKDNIFPGDVAIRTGG